jgi:hypothetical protein
VNIPGDKILNSGKPIQLIGANAFHSLAPPQMML